ncbi:type I polyketide synthase [Baekduia soli]|uniref:type I polyketide synthase n=1 Tax=Baekduia soli TaxID=496014 RepID=UPI001651DBB9|nr:type I polyketide synthase [Baekduia soli]
MSPFDFIVLSAPAGRVDAGPAIAAARAGAIGVLDTELAADRAAATAQLERLCRAGAGRTGVLLEDDGLLDAALALREEGLEVVVTSAYYSGDLSKLVVAAHAGGVRVLATAISVAQALAAQQAGADGVVAKGHEAAGWVGEEGSLILLQRLGAALEIPTWAHGGIGLRTAGAAHVAGAVGAVLDAQVLLARESVLPEDLRTRVGSMDGSETAVLGAGLGAGVRLAAQPGAPGAAALREAEIALEAGEADATARAAWHAAVADAVAAGALLVGQDAAFAAELARRFETVGGIVGALRAAVAESVTAVREGNPLGEGSALARSHGTRYPIVQGPMTRVSDRAEFAAAVAKAGALPFLALALLRGPEVDALLAQTAELAGDRPWGVGILGFVPAELRAEQLAVVRAHRPPFALIAGGRPDQARELEAEGITTYLHVPSPGLLELYLADGARHFVFEGRECGGHVGPRTSFVLWDTMLGRLADALPRDASDCHVLLAGGIHDARSAAMAAAAAAPLAARGARVGALLGTGYLFTREATEHGAITEMFQEAAIAGTETALVESGPGHATRCLPSPFVEHFGAEKRRLRADGVGAAELRDELEALNVGRLRIASKGTDRNPAHAGDPTAPRLAPVDAAQQWERGMFMIGQVATLRDRVTTLADLHDDVAAGSTELLAGLAGPAAGEPSAPPPADVAIIGLGCILPGAPDVATLWSNILDKVDAVGEIPADRWDWRRYYDPDPAAPDKVYSRWGGFIDEVDLDPMALGLPPASLRSIEPFQLLALVTAQAALRDAGYATRPFDRERTSVILGAGGGGADLSVGYTVRSAVPQLLGDAVPEVQDHINAQLPVWTEDSFAGLLMNVAAGRIANRLDFGGTNYTVDAACASSLAALSAGVGELRAGTSDIVLAGGVDAIQNPFAYLCFSKTHALSPNGRCRPFDAAADGIAISEGFATVVLKRLADAERDGDRIYAVVRGVGAASDGRDRSLTAPRPEGQMRALRRAYAQARFSPETVELVEAHGTGTVAGDAAEIEALSRQFSASSDATQWCAIGSVKSMIGHTKATAGVAGVVKTALALHHRVLPPTIGVTEPNPKAGFERSPFYVNSEARPWVREEGAHPRRAGVSAFGFGGTDFHAVLEEYTGERLGPAQSAIDRWPAELLLWRGSREEITAAVDALAARLEAGARPALADLARTLAAEAGDPVPGGCTLAVVAESLEDLQGRLPAVRDVLAGDAERVHAPNGIHFSARPLAAEGRVAFLFPGQGSQAVDMARDVTMAFPEALGAFGLADRVLAGRFERPLSRYVFPPPAFTSEQAAERQAQLTSTDVAQPALGAAELGYLRVLGALGVAPGMVGGHSYGEFVALAAAGCLAEEDLMRLSEARGRAMAEASADAPGAMAAVHAAPEALEGLLAAGDLVVANRNAPDQTVVSGPVEGIEAAIAWCGERDISARRLPVACAFHSPLVASAQRRLAEALQATPLAAPRIPLYSNTTGGRHAQEPEAIAGVLAEHLARPVEFVSEIEAMHADGARLFVEVGPGSVLTALTERILGDREHVAVSLDRRRRHGLVALLHALAVLAAEGVPVRAQRLFEGRSARTIPLASIAPDAGPEPPRPGLWKVDGGRARPADAPVPPIPTSVPRSPEPQEPRVMTTQTNGAAPAVVAPPPSAAAPPPRPRRRSRPASRPPPPSRPTAWARSWRATRT